MPTLRLSLVSAALCLSVGLRAFGQPSLPERVSADFPNTAANAAFHHYAVPAMSENQRLPHAYPDDGVAGGAVAIVAARDEYEPGSFLVWGTRDLGKVAFSLTPFRTAEGEVFPAEDLDLKVVKVWYQNRNAWFSYFGDTGFKLVPELLLNDEDLIRVDEGKTANYARLKGADGAVREYWLNPPRHFDRRVLRLPWYSTERFHCMRPDFDDAETLQLVAVGLHRFKQFMLTAHVRRETKPGLYRGAVRVGEYGEISVAIRVLDFVLPAPKCYASPEKDFLVSSYSYIGQENIADLNGYDFALARRQLVAVLKNQVAHNQTMHMVRGNADSLAFDCIEAMREAGMRMDVFQAGVAPVGPAGEESRARARRVADEFDRRYGHHNVFVGYGDEPGAAWLEKARPVYEDYQRAGLRFFIAGHDQVFHKAGYLYDWHNTATDPSEGWVARRWNALQNGNRVAWYAQQHVGSEDPAFNRRQNGLTAYLSGYTALCNYAHHLGPYNDDSTTYRPMVYAYGCAGGVIDTLQWEGFREGVDDIRYATLMTDLARKAQVSADIRVRYLGGQAMQMLAALDVKSFDQDACRGEMIRFIEALRPHVAGYAAESDWRVLPESDRRAAKARLDEGLARDLAVAREGFAKATRPNQTNDVHRKVAETYAKYFRFAEAGDYLGSVGLWADGARYYDNLPGERGKRARLKALQETSGRDRSRLDAFWNLLPDDPGLADEFDAVVLSGIREGDTNAVKAALNAVFRELGTRRTCFWNERFAAFAEVYERALTAAVRVGLPVPAVVAKNAFEAYLSLGDSAKAVQAAQTGLKDPAAKPAERYHLSLAALLGGLTAAEPVAFRAEAVAFLKREGKDVPTKERLEALDAVSFFNTTYPTFGRRRLEATDGARDYRIETRFFDNRIVTYLFLSWRTWAAKIPHDRSVWDFESLRWRRDGNRCWNGLESIHGRSTWGELEFRLTRRQRNRILKPLIGWARAGFLAEKRCGWWDGIFSHWKDSAVGDPEFYEAELKPLLEKLESACGRVRADADDGELEGLEREILSKWLDVSFEVQRLRVRWLVRRQIEESTEKAVKEEK